MATTLPKAVPKAMLYYSTSSTWSDAVLLALAEKAYAPEELDKKIVDLSKGETLTLSYLRLNIKGTVPTLVVPFADSIHDADSRYKALTDPRAIVEFLDKSRSPQSRTKTISSAAAPTLSPATVAYASATTALLDIIYAEDVSPDSLSLFNAHDDASLKKLAATQQPFVEGIHTTVSQCLVDAESGKIQASEKVKAFWRAKLAETEEILAVYRVADKEGAQLDAAAQSQRQAFFTKGKTLWDAVAQACTKVGRDMVGPYVFGEQFSIADISLAAWLRRLVQLTADGDGALKVHVGEGVLAKFWSSVQERPSWQSI